MSYGSSSVASGAKTTGRSYEFGRTYVVRPKGMHLATVVWLHGLGDNGASWSQLLETLPLPNVTIILNISYVVSTYNGSIILIVFFPMQIKWICPTAPTRPVAVFGGFPSSAWFDVGDLSESGPDDVEGMDASAAHVANLLSAEPADVKLGVGGFSMGAATALYSATCSAHGKYGNGKLYPVNLRAVVGLSGWLPCARSLKNKLEGDTDTATRASSLPILLCHGKGDDVVPYKHGEKSAEALKSSGFENLRFETYNGLGHYTVPGEIDDVCKFLTATLGLDGSQS
ncbi:acyl-protein thioesterase 1 homolog 1-like isoform X1 [Zingiber officinale]|uniref:acyl-protein thioesterase 1 homolog 1-like isoform X1 n=1 Tax=Zingiber officinale TaxID=94328 RepID=UPI001C4A98B2|nr:acyl-protein thioesterase 1 homolog 1-like isoform X1 [Zingiber officinale]